MSDKDWDVFISHASEDKAALVEPLAKALRDLGANVWYDAFTLTVGDSLSRSIDYGLANARFGVVVLSPAFFAKDWPEYELRGLLARELGRDKVVLPIWHNVSRKDVLQYSPPLADKLALTTVAKSPKELAIQLLEVIRPDIYNEVDRRVPVLDTVRKASVEKGRSSGLLPGPIRHFASALGRAASGQAQKRSGRRGAERVVAGAALIAVASAALAVWQPWAGMSSPQRPESKAKTVATPEPSDTPMERRPFAAAKFAARGDSFLQRAKYPEAEIAFEEAVRLQPLSAAYRFNLGRALHGQRHANEAALSFREAVRLDPSNAGYREWLAGLDEDLKRYAEAEAGYREVIRLKPDSVLPLLYLGQFLMRIGRYQDAESTYRQAARLDPGCSIQDRIAYTYRERDRYTDAEKIYREAVRAYPDSASCLVALGEFLVDRSRYVEAETSFRDALRLEPENVSYLCLLGWALMSQGRSAEAERVVRRAAQFEPSAANCLSG